MLRKERLFDLIQILRDGRLHRAQDIADRLQISLRTVYRDMDTLIASGVPIEGARGLGYMATAAITLPPLNLLQAELAVLQRGLAIMAQAPDPEEQLAAISLLAKLDAVLPDDQQTGAQSPGFAVYPFADAARGFVHVPALRAAIRARQKLALHYRDGPTAVTDRAVRPLQLDYWGRVWTVTVWCEWSNDFQVLRVDRITSLKVLSQLFIDEPGKSLADYQALKP